MTNSQMLAKTLISSGQNAQTMQSKQSGSNPTRIQETSQDTSDTLPPSTVTSKESQNGQDKASQNPKDFKQTLTEKMGSKTSEEPVAESSTPETTTLQLAVAPTQPPMQPVVLPSEDQSEPTIEVADALTVAPPEMANNDRVLAHQIQPQNQGQDMPKELTVTSEAVPDVPVAPALEETTQASTLPQASAVPSLQTPAEVAPQNTVPTPQKPEETPVAAQGQMKQTDPKAVNPEYSVPQAKPTETAQPQPEPQAQKMPAPAQSEAVAPSEAVHPSEAVAPSKAMAPSKAVPPSESGAPSEPALAIQSIQQKTDKGNRGIEPLNASSVPQKPSAEAPEPIQVTQPVQQAVTAQLEPSQEQTTGALTTDAPESQPPLAATPSTPTLSPSETQTTTDTPLPRPLDLATTSVARQIQDSIAEGIQANSRQIVIRLDPPELGRVAMRFQESGQSITGVLEVQRSQTRHDIQQALPEIIQQLQDSGVQVKRIEVLLSSDADPETFEDQAFAQAQDQDQNLEHEQASEQNKATRNLSYPWSSSSDQGSFRSAEDQYASDRGINMLI